MDSYEELKTWIIVKLFRNGYVGHRLLDFDDFGKKVDKKSLLKALKELVREDIVLMKPSNRSAKGRFSLNLKTKAKWYDLVTRQIRKGL
jgi:hypothetical protein